VDGLGKQAVGATDAQQRQAHVKSYWLSPILTATLPEVLYALVWVKTMNCTVTGGECSGL